MAPETTPREGTASGETLRGDVIVADCSAASLALKNGTTLKGAITGAALELDASAYPLDGGGRLLPLS